MFKTAVKATSLVSLPFLAEWGSRRYYAHRKLQALNQSSCINVNLLKPGEKMVFSNETYSKKLWPAALQIQNKGALKNKDDAILIFESLVFDLRRTFDIDLQLNAFTLEKLENIKEKNTIHGSYCAIDKEISLFTDTPFHHDGVICLLFSTVLGMGIEYISRWEMWKMCKNDIGRQKADMILFDVQPTHICFKFFAYKSIVHTLRHELGHAVHFQYIGVYNCPFSFSKTSPPFTIPYLFEPWVSFFAEIPRSQDAMISWEKLYNVRRGRAEKLVRELKNSDTRYFLLRAKTGEGVSLYAGTNQLELFAESFVLYSDPNYDTTFYPRLPEDIHAWFTKHLPKHSSKTHTHSKCNYTIA